MYSGEYQKPRKLYMVRVACDPCTLDQMQLAIRVRKIQSYSAGKFEHDSDDLASMLRDSQILLETVQCSTQDLEEG